MYLPAHFTETDMAAMRELVARYPLCTLITAGSQGLVANHLPLMWDDEVLIGHVALANNLHEISSDESQFLAVFQGEDAYVSPNWYPSKQQHHKHVPTWNYRVVHMHGRVTFHHDQRTKASIVGRLTQHHESQTNGEQAWQMRDAPADYLTNMLDNIVGLTLHIDRIEAKSKLSQNRELEDKQGAISALEQNNQQAMANAIRETLNQ